MRGLMLKVGVAHPVSLVVMRMAVLFLLIYNQRVGGMPHAPNKQWPCPHSRLLAIDGCRHFPHTVEATLVSGMRIAARGGIA